MTGLYGIVGGPNTGKTTTVKVFRKRGYRILEETATPIILTEKKTGGVVVPWEDFEAFHRAVFHMQLAKEIIALANIRAEKYDGPIFSDRLAIGDSIGYHDEKGHTLYELVTTSLQDPRNRPHAIFLLEQLPPEAYEIAGARWEDPVKAQRVHACLDEAYRRVARESGAPLIDVPYIPRSTPQKGAEARADFILERIAQGF